MRYANRIHLGIGTPHAGTKVLILVTATTVSVVTQHTNKLIASHQIDPDRNYWRNQNGPAWHPRTKRIQDRAT